MFVLVQEHETGGSVVWWIYWFLSFLLLLDCQTLKHLYVGSSCPVLIKYRHTGLMSSGDQRSVLRSEINELARYVEPKAGAFQCSMKVALF